MVDITIKSSPSVSVVRVTRNAYGSGHAQFGNGSIAMIGGDPFTIGTYTTDGRMTKRLLNSVSSTSIALLGDMTTPRWFPTVLTMIDGRCVCIIWFGNASASCRLES